MTERDTPEERASLLAAAYSGILSASLLETLVEQTAATILQAEREVVAEERERCAAMLDDMATRGESREISAAYSLGATAIRAEHQPEEASE